MRPSSFGESRNPLRALSLLAILLVVACSQGREDEPDRGAPFASGLGWTAQLDSAGLEITFSSPPRGSDVVRVTSSVYRGGAVQSGIREEHLSTPAGVEQRWHVPTLPEGSGALEVRVAIAGAELESLAGAGVGLLLPTGRRAHYGAATWIDADGRTVGVDQQIEAGEVVMRVPAEVLDRSSYPAVLDPIIGPEVIVPTVPGDNWGSQFNLAVAGGAGTFVAVWVEDGSTLSRVDTQGAVLDPIGLTLGLHQPIFDGTNFFLQGAGGRKRLSPAGTVLDNAPFGTPGGKLACGGGVCLAAKTNFGAIAAELYDVNGTVLKTWSFGSGNDLISLTFDGTHFLIPASPLNSPGLSLHRIDIAGNVVDAQPIVIASNGPVKAGGEVACTGGTCMMPAIISADVWGFRFDTFGNALDSGAIQLTATSAHEESPALIVHDGHFVVYATNDYSAGTGAMVVSPDGTVLVSKTQLMLSPGQLHKARLASEGGIIFALGLHDWIQNQGKVFGRRFDAALQPIGGNIVLARDPNQHHGTRLASNGSGYLAVWQDDRNGAQNVYGTRIDAALGVVDGAGFEIVHIPPTNNYKAMNPAVGSNGNDYLVAWQKDSFDLQLAVVSANGAIATGPLDVTTALTGYHHHPAIASDGQGYLLIWSRIAGQQASGPRQIWGQRVDAAGALSSAPFFIADLSTYTVNEYLAIAWDGSHYLVAWVYNTGEVRAIRVSASGNVLDGAPIVVEPTANLVYGIDEVSIACSDGPCAIAYNLDVKLNNVIYPRVRARRMATNGAVLDSTPISIPDANTHASGASITWDGSNFFVAYQIVHSGATPDDLEGIFLSKAGGLGPAGGFSIMPAAIDTWEGPQASSIGNAQSLVAYGRPALKLRAIGDDVTIVGGQGGMGGAGGASVGPGGNGGQGGTGQGGGPIGSGGANAQGGTASPGGGSGHGGANSGNSSSDDDGSSTDGGCGCRTSPSGTARWAPALALAVGLIFAARRRRR
jgi:MYXO-CTERM domain-containing protein